MEQTDTRQLQFWNGKQYEPSAHAGILDPDEARAFACGRAWRIVKAERPLKPKYNAPRYAGYSRSVGQVQREYLIWAESFGLKSVTAYNNRPPANFAADKVVGYHMRKADRSKPVYTGAIQYITLDAHFAVEETTE
jgi:hypothetical protein